MERRLTSDSPSLERRVGGRTVLASGLSEGVMADRDVVDRGARHLGALKRHASESGRSNYSVRLRPPLPSFGSSFPNTPPNVLFPCSFVCQGIMQAPHHEDWGV